MLLPGTLTGDSVASLYEDIGEGVNGRMQVRGMPSHVHQSSRPMHTTNDPTDEPIAREIIRRHAMIAV